MGKMQRTKGRAFEQYVAKQFRAIFGPQTRRGWQARAGTKDASDIIGTPFAIECKHEIRPNPFAAFEQACEAPLERGMDPIIPIAVVKKNRGIPMVFLTLHDFLGMVEALHDSRYFADADEEE